MFCPVFLEQPFFYVDISIKDTLAWNVVPWEIKKKNVVSWFAFRQGASEFLLKLGDVNRIFEKKCLGKDLKMHGLKWQNV